jgi:hypothetical protein
MKAVLPYCDSFVSGHRLTAPEDVVAAVREHAART